MVLGTDVNEVLFHKFSGSKYEAGKVLEIDKFTVASQKVTSWDKSACRPKDQFRHHVNERVASRFHQPPLTHYACPTHRSRHSALTTSQAHHEIRMMKEAELTEEERQLAALARHRKRQRKGYSPLTSPVKPRATFGIARAADVCNNPSSALDNVRRKRTGDEVDYKRPTCSKEQWDENGERWQENTLFEIKNQEILDGQSRQHMSHCLRSNMCKEASSGGRWFKGTGIERE
ncbi:hypothetical protein B0H14DRAFT_3166468 [Mycena olivaceomarginata]|nr:hypothetical protein B0H14DRAFT_3166468 [Mycena olivaceomarginata]